MRGSSRVHAMDHVKYALKVALLFAAYFVTAKIGLALHPVNHFATFVWPPTGIALVAMLILGYRYWPGIAAAAFLTNYTTGAPALVALGIAAGNTLEPVCGAYLLRRYGNFRNSLERVGDVLNLVVFAALFSTVISATVGVASLWLGGTIHTGAIGQTWTAWWVGDMLGDLIFAPLLLVWSRRPRTVLTIRQLAEAGLLIALLLALGDLVFRHWYVLGVRPFSLAYFLSPLLIWAALRFGQRGSVTAIAIASMTAVWGNITSLSGSSPAVFSHDLLLLQSFVGITAMTFMVVAAMVAERETTQAQRLIIAQEAAALAKQQAKLLALNKAKDEFISQASHQLKTPPTVVKQYTGMLLNNYAGKLTKPQRDMLRRIYTSNERQIKTVHDLLNVAQLDNGKVELQKENVDVTKLIAEVLHNKAPGFAERQQTIGFSHGKKKVTAPVDRVKFSQVLENVIDNASKYTPDGKKIAVRLTRYGNKVAISVKDQGIGMTKRDSAKMFKKFARIRQSSPISVDGTGLGLYWSKKIVRLHGGSIKVISTPNRGSTFTITIPDGSNFE